MDKLTKLVKLGKAQGYVFFSDITSSFPYITEKDCVDNVVNMLELMGIKVMNRLEIRVYRSARIFQWPGEQQGRRKCMPE